MHEKQIEQRRGVTLQHHIIQSQRAARGTGEFSGVLSQIGLAGKVIARALSQTGLFDRPDYASSNHAEDDTKRHLNVFAEDTFIRVFRMSPWVSTLVTEGQEDPLHIGKGGKYIVFVNPLEAATNINVNGLLGSIFSIYKRSGSGERAADKDLLQKGTEQVGAGYILYGPSTMLVYTSGNGVNAFTLDTGVGEFLISQENIHIPERGVTYSCNEAYFHDWPVHTQKYIEYLRRRDPKSDKHYSSRYAGSLIANLHRTLIKGGVFLSPVDTVTSTGKLSLMYACNPLAMIVEQAGGKASTGTERVLKIQPTSHHSVSSMVIGSSYEVLLFEDFCQGKKS